MLKNSSTISEKRKRKLCSLSLFLVKMGVHDNDIYLNGVLYLEVLIIGGCLLLGIILISISIYQFVKEIKEKISKNEKWEVVAQNLIGLFSDPLHGARFYFLVGGLFFVVGLLFL